MEIIERATDLRAALGAVRSQGRLVGLVPTMGALHEAHLKLAEQARGENDLVVMSIFVNPAQFGPSEDFDRYPRPLQQDKKLARESGLVDVLFVPPATEMYPQGIGGERVWVDPGTIGQQLEGTSRPGHFRGVATVVAKLFNLVQPDRAYFGQKDAQQVAVLQAMVRDLKFPVDIRAVPTVREADGLALSSRNAYLSANERAQAPALHEALRRAQTAFQSGVKDARVLETEVRGTIEHNAPLAHIDYVAAVDPTTFELTPSLIEDNALLALAVRFGDTRLIDNELLVAGAGSDEAHKIEPPA